MNKNSDNKNDVGTPESQEFKTIKIKKEIDEPFSQSKNDPLNTMLTQYSSHQADYFEKQANYADRMDKHVYKKHGLKLMVGCGIAYFIIVIFDTLCVNIGSWTTSSLTSGFVELLKFTASTLIGFVFSENLKKDK